MCAMMRTQKSEQKWRRTYVSVDDCGNRGLFLSRGYVDLPTHLYLPRSSALVRQM